MSICSLWWLFTLFCCEAICAIILRCFVARPFFLEIYAFLSVGVKKWQISGMRWVSEWVMTITSRASGDAKYVTVSFFPLSFYLSLMFAITFIHLVFSLKRSKQDWLLKSWTPNCCNCPWMPHIIYCQNNRHWLLNYPHPLLFLC